VPGIQPTDVQELIEHGARAVVLSKGMWERLQVCPETVEVLDKNGIQVEVLQTEAAVERFVLRENMPVGGLIKRGACGSGGLKIGMMRAALFLVLFGDTDPTYSPPAEQDDPFSLTDDAPPQKRDWAQFSHT
jgi:hypothetical protein